MAPSQVDFQEENPFSLLDALYCEEEKWESDEDDDEELSSERANNGGTRTNSPCLLPLLLLEQDLFWEDEEIVSLFSKEQEEEEKQGSFRKQGNSEDCHEFDICSRKEAVEWIIKVNSYYGFCTLTCVLAVNYFDRFFSIFQFQRDKPWMFQLTAVTCLSLAAKVEETDVPLLLDLQVEVGKYMFDAKTIQKMELLVLSTLEWKMNPVTPLSFLDHIIRRLGLKNHLHWEFLRRCQALLLSLLSDWRMVSYQPSVLATATMMHVIDQIEPSNPLDYQNQLLSVLNISKEKVNNCYQVIVEKSANDRRSSEHGKLKRTFDDMTMKMNYFPPPPPPPAAYNSDTIPSSPSGVMDAYYFSCDSSNDSWAATTTTTTTTTTTNSNNHRATLVGSSTSLSSSLSSSSVSSSVSSSPVMNRKKSRVHEQLMPLQLPSLSRVFVDAVGSPH